ncbi:unnamed protein product [Trichogramma brassicae]|uniref:Uncharacterized protein n=1 Tax=Trichogramma brassicae TaxID=86971 RepID=A0A6H5J5Y3_9HYME|nr:unnamed protein product [Trichogramma brassicae]
MMMLIRDIVEDRGDLYRLRPAVKKVLSPHCRPVGLRFRPSAPLPRGPIRASWPRPCSRTMGAHDRPRSVPSQPDPGSHTQLANRILLRDPCPRPRSDGMTERNSDDIAGQALYPRHTCNLISYRYDANQARASSRMIFLLIFRGATKAAIGCSAVHVYITRVYTRVRLFPFLYTTSGSSRIYTFSDRWSCLSHLNKYSKTS